MDDDFSAGRRGLALILSSPSGAGKTTLTRMLVDRVEDVSLSVSLTTRRPRENEVEGVHYYFSSESEFFRARDSGELLEWAEVFGCHYGTPRSPTELVLSSGGVMALDIDWQGARQAAKNLKGDVVSVFLLPPSASVLRSRLESRAVASGESSSAVADRFARALDEIRHWDEYDYVLINDDLEATYGRIANILEVERLRRERNPRLAFHTDRLLRDVSSALSPRSGEN